jgi:hypothetical protein
VIERVGVPNLVFAIARIVVRIAFVQVSCSNPQGTVNVLKTNFISRLVLP